LYVERAGCYRVLGDATKSVSDFLDALVVADKKSDIVYIKSQVALAMVQREGLKEQALFWAMGAVDEDPENADAYHTLGLICEVCGYLNVAVESLRRALVLEPHHWDAMRVLGSCLRENCQIEELIDTLSRYVANNPHEPLGLYELAWSLHVRLGSNEHLREAKNCYEMALNNNPSLELRTVIERKLRDIHTILK